MNIGVAGVGRMGAAIALRLIESGHDVVVWNRTAGKTKPLADAGAKVAGTARELAERSEAVITIVMDADAIDAVYNGKDGLLSGDVKGKLFIEMSTVLAETQIALAEKVRAKGASLVECPVGGTTGPARQGKLIGVMGAEPADADRARPILEQLCRRLEHVGPVGAGAKMKLAINLPLLVSWQAFGESLALCRGVGLDPDRMMELFGDISGGTNAMKNRGANIAIMLKGGDPGAATFDIDGGRKDLRTMLEQAKRQGVELPLVERALACYDQASRDGWGSKDNAAMPVYWSGRKKS
jgi:3-hydroxyisobutyrate dehydrogenase